MARESSAVAVVELVGATGVGKTTFGNALNQFCVLRDSAVDLRRAEIDPIVALSTVKRFLSLLPHYMTPYREGLLIRNPMILRSSIRIWRHTKRLVRARAAAQPHSIFVADPGFLMLYLNCWMYAQRLPSENELASFLDAASAPKLVVCITADPNLAMRRISKRPRGLPERLAAEKPDIVRKVIEQGNSLTRMISILAPKLGYEVLMLENNEEGDLVSKVPEIVANHLDRQVKP